MLFVFEDYTLDTDRRELRHGASLLSVEPQVFDLLAYLIVNRDRVVSRDDLLAGVWGGRIVSDSTLASRLHAARRAIGDSGGQQRLIRTVLRKGVRFVAAVRPVHKPEIATDWSASVSSWPISAQASDRGCSTETGRPARRHGRAAIAVMPFQADCEAAASFAGGLSHDLTTGLARLGALFVIARGSTETLRHHAADPRAIGRALDVDYVATGAVARDHDRLIVTLDLGDAENGRMVWTERYAAPLVQPFTVQGDIVARIVGSLDAEIAISERNRAILRPPNSLDAWEAHHRGLWHMYRFTGTDNEQAQRHFERAVELDPTFSRAYAGLSFTHWQNAFQFKSAERQREADYAYDAAGRGLLADHRDPAAHWALGRALWLRCEDAASLAELGEAIALSPNFAIAHYSRAFVEAQTGDPRVALDATATARQLSPFDPMLYAVCAARAWALFRLDRREEAAACALMATQKPNAHAHARAMCAFVLGSVGRPEEARREIAAVRHLRPGYSIDDFLSAFRLHRDQERACRLAARRLGIG